MDLMVERRKRKLGVSLTSSEKAEAFRYANYGLNSVPYPGCEFFTEYKHNRRSGVGLNFDWNQSYVDACLSLVDRRGGKKRVDLAETDSWKDYRSWDVVELTRRYLKMMLEYIKDDREQSGMLVHCISGWDRTPLFISLLRLSLWADGEVHQNLDAREILYLTIAYDWMFFGHQLSNRLRKGEDVFYFCFDFLQYITAWPDDKRSSSASKNSSPSSPPAAEPVATEGPVDESPIPLSITTSPPIPRQTSWFSALSNAFSLSPTSTPVPAASSSNSRLVMKSDASSSGVVPRQLNFLDATTGTSSSASSAAIAAKPTNALRRNSTGTDNSSPSEEPHSRLSESSALSRSLPLFDARDVTVLLNALTLEESEEMAETLTNADDALPETANDQSCSSTVIHNKRDDDDQPSCSDVPPSSNFASTCTVSDVGSGAVTTDAVVDNATPENAVENTDVDPVADVATTGDIDTELSIHARDSFPDDLGASDLPGESKDYVTHVGFSVANQSESRESKQDNEQPLSSVSTRATYEDERKTSGATEEKQVILPRHSKSPSLSAGLPPLCPRRAHDASPSFPPKTPQHDGSGKGSAANSVSSTKEKSPVLPTSSLFGNRREPKLDRTSPIHTSTSLPYLRRDGSPCLCAEKKESPLPDFSLGGSGRQRASEPTGTVSQILPIEDNMFPFEGGEDEIDLTSFHTSHDYFSSPGYQQYDNSASSKRSPMIPKAEPMRACNSAPLQRAQPIPIAVPKPKSAGDIAQHVGSWQMVGMDLSPDLRSRGMEGMSPPMLPFHSNRIPRVSSKPRLPVPEQHCNISPSNHQQEQQQARQPQQAQQGNGYCLPPSVEEGSKQQHNFVPLAAAATATAAQSTRLGHSSSRNDFAQREEELGLSFADGIPRSKGMEPPSRTASIYSTLDKKEIGPVPTYEEGCKEMSILSTMSSTASTAANTITSTSGSTTSCSSQFHTLPNTELLEQQMKASLFSSPPLRPQQPQLLFAEPSTTTIAASTATAALLSSSSVSATNASFLPTSSPSILASSQTHNDFLSAPTDSASQLVPDNFFPSSFDALAESHPSVPFASSSSSTASSCSSTSSELPFVEKPASGCSEYPETQNPPEQLTERAVKLLEVRSLFISLYRLNISPKFDTPEESSSVAASPPIPPCACDAVDRCSTCRREASRKSSLTNTLWNWVGLGGRNDSAE